MKRKKLPAAQLKALLHQYGITARKSLGQHFLIDESVLEQIVSAAELNPEDIVIEVGPGLGTLTKQLAEHVAKVIAVELDSKLVEMLRRELPPFSNVSIVNADILQITPSQLLERYSGFSGGAFAANYKVVANLPYYITSPVLRHFLEASLKPSLMVVMVQREVGEAIVASEGKMSLLSIGVQFYSKPTITARVSAKSFYPPPKVNSVVLRLDLYSKPVVEVTDIPGFFEVVGCGFRSPRKQLRNSLARGLEMSPGEIDLLLEEAGIEGKRRPETLSLEEWRKLWEVLVSPKKGHHADCFSTS